MNVAFALAKRLQIYKHFFFSETQQ